MGRLRLGILAIAGTVLLAPAAHAEPATGTTELQLGGPAARSLNAKLIATDPATASKRALKLPAFAATFGETVTIEHSGVLQFRAGDKRVNVVSARTVLGPEPHTTALIS